MADGLAVASSLIAFVVGPRLLTPLLGHSAISDQAELASAARNGFVTFWNTDGRFDSDLEHAVDYWSRYHLLKAVFAALIVLTTFSLARRLLQGYLRSSSSPRALALGSSTSVIGLVGAFFVLVTMANVQGMMAPFASLFPLLASSEGGPSDGIAAQMRQQLLDTGDGGAPMPAALRMMVDDFARFHVVLAASAAVVAVLVIIAGISAWRRSTRSRTADRRHRLTRGTLSTSALLTSLALVFIAAANLATAAAPVPALASALGGGL